MKNIQDSIRAVPASRIAVVNKTDEYSYGKLALLQKDNIDTINAIRGSSVVIRGRDKLEFYLILSMLDGQVKRILFLPADIDSSISEKYFNDAEIDFEVSLESNRLSCCALNLPFVLTDNNSLKENVTEWVIPTSGTTNIPKLVPHTFQSLTRTGKLDVERGEKYRWGLVFDIYRFSGIQVLLQSLLGGSTLIIAETQYSMSEMLNLFANNGCNALSATPSFWRKVLMTKESENLVLERVTLGGEIADNNILQALKGKFGQAKITHIYASTEVGVVFSVKDGLAGFPATYLNETEDTIKMKINSHGVLCIAPKNTSKKYFSGDGIYDAEGYINTGDLVRVENNRVYFLGRNSGAINVGGNKVQPEEVELILLDTGFLNAAHVYAIQNPMMGSLVCADVILTKEHSNEKQVKSQILKICRENLESFKVPAIIKCVDEIPMSETGKLKRGVK